MKKEILFLLIITILVVSIYPQIKEIIYGAEIDGFVKISGEIIDLNIMGYQYNGKYDYQIETKNNIHLLKYADITNIICFSDKLLYLVNSKSCFYEGIGYTGNGRNGRHINFIGIAEKYTSSSFLIEGDIRYEAENLRIIRPDLPWVEGVKGDGIGEYVEMEWGYDINGLIIVNGFISLNRPELYSYNNRVKLIRINIDGSSEYSEYEIKDATDPQIIKLSNPGKKIKLQIVDVYKGSRWDDTCISMIQGISIGAYDVFFDP